MFWAAKNSLIEERLHAMELVNYIICQSKIKEVDELVMYLVSLNEISLCVCTTILCFHHLKGLILKNSSWLMELVCLCFYLATEVG
jgi:hypothetical protein